MVVVLPEPLTPTTRMTNGFAPATTSGFATGSKILATSSAMIAFTSSAVGFSLKRPLAIASETRIAASIPRSVRISASSISSSMAGSSGRLFRRLSSVLPIDDEVRFSPPASRPHQPFFSPRFRRGLVRAVTHACRRDTRSAMTLKDALKDDAR